MGNLGFWWSSLWGSLSLKVFFAFLMFVPFITSFFLFFNLHFYECNFFSIFDYLSLWFWFFFPILKCLSLLLWGFILIFRSIYLWDLFIFLRYRCFWGMSIFWGPFVHIWKELGISESSLWKPIWNYGSHGRVACNITNLTKKISFKFILIIPLFNSI